MILPPDEARTKWCPFLSDTRTGDLKLCGADACMAWRWAPDRSPEEVEQRNNYMHGQAKPPAGYCGA